MKAPRVAAGQGTNAYKQSLARYKPLLKLLENGPTLPHQQLVYAYAQMCVTMLENDTYIRSSLERDIHDLLRFGETGAVNLHEARDRILKTARAALAGNAQAFAIIADYVDRWPVQRALATARATARTRAR